MKQSPAMRRGPLVSFAAGVALVAAATAARADEAPARVAIEWRAGPGAESCAGAEQLRTAAAAQVRINAIVDDAGIADVVVRGSSVRTSDGWRATILVSTWAGRELGRRELTEAGADCAALDAALVVVLAMIADSSMVDNARGSDPRPPDEPHMVPPRPPPPPPQDPVPVEPPPRWHIAVIASAGGELGRLPDAAGAADLAARIEPPSLWPIELGIEFTTESTADTGAGGSAFRYAGASLLACSGRGASGRLAIEPCAGAAAGAMTADAFDFRDTRSRRALTIDARFELRGELRVSRAWFVRATASARLALVRPGFSYETESGSLESLHQPGLAAGAAQIGVGVRFR
jgi:hypothetical protein